MPKALSVLFGAAFTILTAWALGRLFVRQLRLRLHREEEHLFAFITGAALLSLLLFALAALRWIYDPALLALGLAILLTAWRTGALRSSSPALPALPRAWRWLFLVVYAPFAIVVLVHAMAPEISPDGSSYHLGVMARFYREHGFIAMPHHMYAHLSQGVDLLFLNAWAFGRHSAAALTHCAFLLALPWMIVCFGQRTGHARAGVAAALFVFASPVVMIAGASAYNDVALAAILFAVFYAAEVFREQPSARAAVLLGVLAGYAYGAKYTAFVAAVYALWVIWRAQARPLKRALGVFCAAAALLIAPWMARNFVHYGNPFSPLLNAWFPNPYIHVSFEQNYAQEMRRYVGLESYADLPLELTVRGLVLGGIVGPLFLLAPVGLLALRLPLGRRLLMAALLFALPYALNVGTRFLIPALPMLAFAMALAVPARALVALIAAHAVLSWPWIMPRYSDPHAWRIERFAWRAALRLEPAEYWLDREWPPYRIARVIEQTTPRGAVVYGYSPPPESYTTREIRVSYQSAEGERLRDGIVTALMHDYQPVHRYEFRFTPVRLRALRVAQTAQGRDLWSIAEFRVFDDTRELERDERWRLRARPFPWDVPLAFDNSPLTRWRSWQPIEPGMFVEARFHEAQRVSMARLEMSSDQYAVRMTLEGQGEDGQWRLLNDAPVRTGLAPPLELRRAAMEELRRAGITHLLVSEGEFGWEDFRDKSALWHITEVATVGSERLYRLE